MMAQWGVGAGLVVQRYSSTHNVEARRRCVLKQCAGRFTPGKQTWYQLYRRQGGPIRLPGVVWKIFPSPRFEPPTVQPIASC